MKNKLLFVLVFISIFIFAGCSGEVTENDVEKSQTEETTWNGPTTGPWETWNRSNNGDQYFKYELVYGNEDTTGWVTIGIKDLGNDNYEFDVELTVYNYYSTSPTGETTYNETANFILDKKEGFFEATYDKGEMSGAIYEIIGRLDEQGAIAVDFDENDIVWEEGATAHHPGNNISVNTKGKTEILGISAYEVEMLYLGLEEGPRNYVINPDIKYPLSIYEESANGINFYKFTLVEYNVN